MMTMNQQQRRLGRRYAPDERDMNFPMRSILPRQRSPRTFRYWYAYTHHLDQGFRPHCVGFSLMHYLVDAPITKVVPETPAALYFAAQLVDEWEGEDYDGTSVRAGARVLRSWGYIDSYHWAWDTDMITQAVLTTGPVVVGTNWYTDMFRPDGHGVITPTGTNEGGHAYVINGVNTRTGWYRIKNSWGSDWGRPDGHAWIKITDFALLLREHGEALLAVESPR